MLALLFYMAAFAFSLKPIIMPRKLLGPTSSLFVSSANKDRPYTYPAPRRTPTRENTSQSSPTSRRTPNHNASKQKPSKAVEASSYIPTSSPPPRLIFPATLVAWNPILHTLEPTTSRSPISASLSITIPSQNPPVLSTKSLNVKLSAPPSSLPSFLLSNAPSVSPSVVPVTSHPSRSPSEWPTKNPTLNPSDDPSSTPSFPPSKVPSSSNYLIGSTLFFLSTVPYGMDNETQFFFYDITSKFIIDFLIDSSIIKTEHDLVDFHFQSTVTENRNFTETLPLQSGASVQAVQFRTLKVEIGLEIRLIQSLISSLSISTFDWLLSSAFLSPTYIDSLQSNDKSGFFSRASIYSTYSSAEMQTSAAVQQDQEVLNAQQNTNNKSFAAIIAVSVLSTLLVVFVVSIVTWYFNRGRRGVLYIKDTKHDILNTSTKGKNSKLDKHKMTRNENLGVNDGVHKPKLISSIEPSLKRDDKNPIVQQHFLPYPSNSPLTCDKANLVSECHPVNTAMMSSGKLSASSAHLHSTIPPLILLDCVEDACENQHGIRIHNLPEYTLTGKQQQPRNRYSESSPCHSSLSNSPATAFSTQGGGTIEPDYDDDHASVQKSIVVEACNQNSSIEPDDGFDLQSYYSKSSKAANKISRSRQHRATSSEKRFVTGVMYQVDAPLSGRLGLTIDSTESQGPPTIREIKNYSPLFGVVQLGDSIIMIDRYVTEDMSSGQIAQLLAHLRNSRSDGSLCIRITLLRASETTMDCDRGNIRNAARYHPEQECRVESTETGNNFIMMANPSEIVSAQGSKILRRTAEPISEGEEEDSVEESVHLLGSLEKEENLVSYYASKDYDKLLKSIEIYSEQDRQSCILVDEREPECFETRTEEGSENTFHLLGGLNRGSFDYDGEESF